MVTMFIVEIVAVNMQYVKGHTGLKYIHNY